MLVSRFVPAVNTHATIALRALIQGKRACHRTGSAAAAISQFFEPLRALEG
jgi:hypothetical protein